MASFGGEMELSAARFAQSTYQPAGWPFENYITVASGRIGIRVILQMLSPTEPFLLPSYLCESVIQPFHEIGVPIAFYNIRPDLTIDLSDLEAKVEKYDPSGILFIHYFGFPINSEAKFALNQLKQRIWLIEDYSHRPILEEDPIGHFQVTSFRKYLPVPDGGLVVNYTDLPFPVLEEPPGDFVGLRLLGKLMRYEHLHGTLKSFDTERTFLELFKVAEHELDTSRTIGKMSAISEQILSQYNIEQVIKRRRENYSALASRLTSSASYFPLFNNLPEGASPLVFPLLIPKERDSVRRKLIEQHIFASVYWPVPPLVRSDEFPVVHQLAADILCLPLDQRYTEKDMEIMAERVASVAAGSA